MVIRTIRTEEIEKFADLSFEKEFLNKLSYLWEIGFSSHDLCFVIEEDGKFSDGIVYWSFPTLANELMILDLFTDWNSVNNISLLLRYSLDYFRKNGGVSVEARLFSDNSYNIFEKKKFFIENKIPIIQEKYNYIFNRGKRKFKNLKWNKEICCKNIDETGEEEFINVIEKISDITFDSYENYIKKNIGNRRHAEDLFKVMKEIDYNPELWNITYFVDGTILGLFISQIINSELGVINYLGVVPEFRNQGYGNFIFNRAIEAILFENIENIIIDIDNKNIPMLKIACKNGFSQNYKVWIFKEKLKNWNMD